MCEKQEARGVRRMNGKREGKERELTDRRKQENHNKQPVHM
jgi:hypothetical protein